MQHGVHRNGAEIKPNELDAVSTAVRIIKMEITVNRKVYTFDCSEMPLSEVLDTCNIATTGIAVAVNNKIIRRADWSTTVIADGDALTVITAVCGG